MDSTLPARMETNVSNSPSLTVELGDLLNRLEDKHIGGDTNHYIAVVLISGVGTLHRYAPVFAKCLRRNDVLAQWSEQRFVLMLNDLTSLGDAEAITERIYSVVSQNNPQEARHLRMGVSFVPAHRLGLEVLTQASSALSQAEVSSQNLVFYNELLHQDALGRYSALQEMHLGLERGEFFVLFQPCVSLQTGRVHAAEALVRWSHPERGTVSPAEFIPLAESSHFIRPLGRFVLERAIEQGSLWHHSGFDLKVAVNVSLKQLDERFVADTLTLLKHYALPAHLLELELTETIFIDADAVTILRKLRRHGIRIALDDFGTGYACLVQLKHLSVDTLKIDRAFIRDVGKDRTDDALVKTFIALSECFNLDLIAEGVETSEQRDILLKLGCTDAQGFFFHRPLTVDALNAALQAKT